MNIFELATRKKYRFASAKGSLTVEQLWDLPLTGATSLNSVAQATNQELKGATEESFVVVTPNPLRTELESKLEVVKHIIAVRMKESEDAKSAAVRREKRNKLLDALAAQEDKALQTMSREDILKQLAELDG